MTPEETRLGEKIVDGLHKGPTDILKPTQDHKSILLSKGGQGPKRIQSKKNKKAYGKKKLSWRLKKKKKI